MPAWQVASLVDYAEEGAAFLSISASDPELLKNVDSERIAKTQKARGEALKRYYELLMGGSNQWSIISIPTKGWATKVYPELSEEKALEKLWEEIFKIVRIDEENPVQAWEKHLEDLNYRASYLNEKKLKKIHMKNSLGTDLEIELPKGHLWVSGGDKTKYGVPFIANMPTEEVFTMPKRDGVNGRVVSTKPLNYGGNLIEKFSFTFKDGKIVDFGAAKGIDILEKMITLDEGAKFLGEVALVPYDSPISNSKTLFYNTLYDENASCHLAVGEAYASCMENGVNMSKEELIEKGANNSITHVDFMVGSEDMEITGTSENGEEIVIFKNGNWAF
jgi:aminopeptidase